MSDNTGKPVIFIRRICYNCAHWSRGMRIKSARFCVKQEDYTPLHGWCPFHEINGRIITSSVLKNYTVERQ